MHKKLKEMSEIKDNLIKWVDSEVGQGKDACCSSYEDVKVMGEVIDMIKDLAEAEEKCMKACYYKTVVAAMEEEGAKEPQDREWESVFGYNNRRYASSGRYAPAGRGEMMGYMPPYGRPMMTGMRMMDEPDNGMYDRMGYVDYRNGDDARQNGMGYTKSQTGNMSRYGYPYEQYRDSRRHYTETRSAEDHKRMNDHAKEHLDDTVTTMRDIWKDADPDLKSRMKTELTKLVGEMN